MTRTKHSGFNEAAKTADIEFLRRKNQSCRQQTNKKTLLNIYYVYWLKQYFIQSMIRVKPQTQERCHERAKYLIC